MSQNAACAVPLGAGRAGLTCYPVRVASRSQTEQQQPQTIDLAQQLDELANKIERLKTLYEQYFMGIEKVEPQTSRKEVTRVMLQLQQQSIRNTALRFKFNTMLQKWNIYVTYWNRVLREIENGTYVRHLQKVKRKAEREGRELPSEMGFNRVRHPSGSFSVEGETGGGEGGKSQFHDIDTGQGPKTRQHDDLDLEEVWDQLAAPRAAAPPPPPPRRAMPPPLPPALPKIPGMNEQDLRKLHQRYVEAQKASGAPATVKYETLVHSLARQVPELLRQTGVKAVRFDVAVEKGKPVLKAFPQKK
jgi:hypothetical protein